MIIAKSINPTHPDKASMQAEKMVLNEIEKRLNEEQSFVIETTLSGKLQLRLIDKARTMGWKINLVYAGVNSSDISIKRVKMRYQMAWHNVKDSDIIRRYNRSMQNLKAILLKGLYVIELINNSDKYHQLVMKIGNNKVTHKIQNIPHWVNKILEGTKL